MQLMKKLLFFLIGIPLCIAVIALAILNRHFVPVYIDPLALISQDNFIELPLFVIAFAMFLTGVILGGAVMWYTQRNWRQKTRLGQREINRLTRENRQQQAIIASLDEEKANKLPTVAA